MSPRRKDPGGAWLQNVLALYRGIQPSIIGTVASQVKGETRVVLDPLPSYLPPSATLPIRKGVYFYLYSAFRRMAVQMSKTGSDLTVGSSLAVASAAG